MPCAEQCRTMKPELAPRLLRQAFLCGMAILHERPEFVQWCCVWCCTLIAVAMQTVIVTSQSADVFWFLEDSLMDVLAHSAELMVASI